MVDVHFDDRPGPSTKRNTSRGDNQFLDHTFDSVSDTAGKRYENCNVSLGLAPVGTVLTTTKQSWVFHLRLKLHRLVVVVGCSFTATPFSKLFAGACIIGVQVLLPLDLTLRQVQISRCPLTALHISRCNHIHEACQQSSSSLSRPKFILSSEINASTTSA